MPHDLRTTRSARNEDAPKQLQILLIEDSEADAILLGIALAANAHLFAMTRHPSLEDGIQAIKSGTYDALLLDLSLPDSSAQQTLERLPEIAGQIPTIVLTGMEDEATDRLTVERGAQDYIPKSDRDPKLIRRTIEHAVERFRIEQSLAEARKDALNASAVKSNFVSAMSHEIRTPLNAILGMADLLSTSSLDEQQREYVGVFQRSGRALLSLINGVLDLASIEHGKFDLVEGPFSVRDLVDETAETFAFEAHKKRLGLTVETASDVPEIAIGDADRLRQIIANLLGNAVKFTDSGQIAVRVERHGEKLRFEVHDSGIGIETSKLQTIFEPFERAPQDPSHVYGGTGLGLALCRQLAERMGGQIEARHADEGGTVVSVELPLPSDREFDVGPLRSEGTRILVSVSSPAERDSISRLCMRDGAVVDTVSCCSSALQRIEADPARYEMLIVDCRIPENGGFSLIRSLQEHQSIPRTLVLLPMDHRPEDMAICRDLNVDALIKPVRENRLLNWVANEKSTEASQGSALAEHPEKHDLRGLRILHADDSPDNRMLVDAYLRNHDCELYEVGDGVAAVEAFTKRPFDIVLMDVQMPRMSGLEATKRIRDIETRLGRVPVPVLALTANAFKEQADECLAAGATKHLSKPISADRLLEAIAVYAKDATEAARDELDLSQVDPEIADLVPGYLARRVEEIAELRAALDEDAFETLRRIGHNLKGTGGGYGMPALSDVGARLEQSAAEANRDSAKNEVDILEGLVETFLKLSTEAGGTTCSA